MFSLINNNQTDEIKINNQKFIIDFSFPTVLQYFELLEDDKLSDIEKIYQAFMLFVGEDTGATFEQMAKAINAINDLIIADPFSNNDKQGVTGATPPRLFSYTKDAATIYASFMYDYKIDLLENQQMSWFKFKALFDNLSAESPLMRLIQIRKTDTSKIEDTDEKAQIESLQQHYSLMTEKERQQQFIDQQNAFGAMLTNLAKKGG